MSFIIMTTASGYMYAGLDDGATIKDCMELSFMSTGRADSYVQVFKPIGFPANTKPIGIPRKKFEEQAFGYISPEECDKLLPEYEKTVTSLRSGLIL